MSSPAIKIVSDPAEMQKLCREARRSGPFGFVPTMGALHRGHLSLIEASRQRDAQTAVSIFVNPKQFGPSEDFSCYPRQLEKDLPLLDRAGVQLVFAPSDQDIYPPGFATTVHVAALSERLCGRSRPGHFDGVATVVLKLLNIVTPDRVYFGQKDAAQVAVVRRMIADVNLAVEFVVCPIVREPDGLALSSRNAYLSESERESALVLSRALRQIAEQIKSGTRQIEALLHPARETIAHTPGVKLDFLEAVDANTLVPVGDEIRPNTLFAVAAWVGKTRLIDNLLLTKEGKIQM